ncbi:hypothetical protein [Streptosporangium sp. NPDC000396]|uniref:hypothetical protein n=1 Tax=Streptosporangium sp. NPDC000396 TaxID=3366185 RepID=UPI0036AF1B6B
MFARSAVVVALSLAVLTACGSEPASAPVAAPTRTQGDVAQNAWRMERIKADCMKQKGFTYVPFVMPRQKQSETERRAEQGDYAAMKELRAKYGFKVFARFIYPGDPQAGDITREMFPVDPNERIQDALNLTQINAYDNAQKDCTVKAAQEVVHKKVTSQLDLDNQRFKKLDQVMGRELDGDPRLVELAAPFGDCLKAKGYPVTSLKPTVMAVSKQRAEAIFLEAKKLGRGKRHEDLSHLAPEQLRPYLVKEIKTALDDLECGKDFYAVYLPKKQEIEQRVQREFGS